MPLEMESDYSRLKQILINILRNSTKFTFKGFIQVSAKTSKLMVRKKKKLLAPVDAIRFEIFDTGIGISEENQANMFQLFGKVMQKNKNINKEGIGLGLYITKNLVAELGGIIELQSKEGEFTKFIITLPV